MKKIFVVMMMILCCVAFAKDSKNDGINFNQKLIEYSKAAMFADDAEERKHWENKVEELFTKAEQRTAAQRFIDEQEDEVYWWMQETEIELPKAEAFPKDAVLMEIK